MRVGALFSFFKVKNSVKHVLKAQIILSSVPPLRFLALFDCQDGANPKTLPSSYRRLVGFLCRSRDNSYCFEDEAQRQHHRRFENMRSSNINAHKWQTSHAHHNYCRMLSLHSWRLLISCYRNPAYRRC